LELLGRPRNAVLFSREFRKSPLDLGPGELAAMALALENPAHVVLLDDALARRVAQAAGLTVWGTLRVLLEAKAQGLTARITPFVDRLADSEWYVALTGDTTSYSDPL
jgi:predicted nucleic acid-binding protein